MQVMRRSSIGARVAEEASQADLAIFIDARKGESPGEVACEPIEREPIKGSTYSHELSLSAIVQLARELYGRSPRAYLLHGLRRMLRRWRDTFTGRVAALPELVARVKTLIS